jgi:hypothetical protein
VTEQPLFDVDPAARRAFDYYPTPAWMTRSLLRRVSLFDVVEPCAGDGAIARVLRGAGIRVLTNDLDQQWPTDWHEDATKEAFWECLSGYAWRPYYGVTNVPFNLADRIVPLAVNYLPWFATILRLSWLEPTAARAPFLKAHPPSRVIVLPRHDFRGNGATDSVTSAWFIWDDNQVGKRGIEVVTKEERDELIALAD